MPLDQLAFRVARPEKPIGAQIQVLGRVFQLMSVNFGVLRPRSQSNAFEPPGRAGVLARFGIMLWGILGKRGFRFCSLVFCCLMAQRTHLLEWWLDSKAVNLDPVARCVLYEISQRKTSITRIAARSGVNRDVIGRWLRGERSIRLDQAIRITDLLDLDLVPVRRSNANGTGQVSRRARTEDQTRQPR